MDWICAQNLGAGISKLKEVVDKLQAYAAQLGTDAQYAQRSSEYVDQIDLDDTWLYAKASTTTAFYSRDFSEDAKERLLGLAAQTTHGWDLFDAVKDDWLKYLYHWQAFSTASVDAYDQAIIDMNNATPIEVEDIWSAVANTDQSYARSFAWDLEGLTSAIGGLADDASSLTKLSDYKASTYGKRMATLDIPDVFDSIGLYGGDQMSMGGSEEIDLANIVRQFFPDKTDSQINQFLQNSKGTCRIPLMGIRYQSHLRTGLNWQKGVPSRFVCSPRY
jgi:hypothetical protein